MSTYNFSQYPKIQHALQEYANFGTMDDFTGLMEALQELVNEIERLREIECQMTKNK